MPALLLYIVKMVLFFLPGDTIIEDGDEVFFIAA
jgi:hypothetical protein